ncbi:hypothetical protein [Sphingomonas sp. CFBP 13733]|uniref:hypothetical protein n=1 Tax=Sphingomonas sp. CFBP 13733 TaxID=2775291 RepID=UPI0017827FA5|nr:hypothetical protein [Sphingomonas sp. CFBP 13733]MBD8640245.1 hypothetical protein [Sphingomonas sp. CFBP 13733]
MVDDVFDAPAPELLDRAAFAAFRAEYNRSAELRQAVVRVAGRGPDVLGTFDDLEDRDIDPIWTALYRTRISGRRLNTTHAATVRALFEGHGHDLLAMLDLVAELLSLFRKDLGRLVTVHGSDYDPDEVAKSDIVLVDFFLGQNITRDQALELSTKAVSDVADAARAAGRAPPSFLLVSSRPDEIEIDKFREQADLMKSRFRFFPKAALTAESIDELVSLHDLVDAANRASVVEGLLDDWRDGARKAVDVVYKRMLELDVSDLVYLDCFRLTHEGVTVANYLRWFLTASLHARVTGELDKSVWRKAEGLRLFDVLNDGGQLDPSTLVKTFDGPSDTIAHAYGDILFDTSRASGKDAFPSPIAAADLVEGDLFVKPKGRDRKGYDGAQVMLVMTPSCDLLPRAKGLPPAAKTVLLVPGTMHLMEDQDMDADVTKSDLDFVRVRERGEWRTFHLVWNHKSPTTIDWATISTSGVGPGFRRLGRLRELYFHKIRELFANQFTRIGTEVPPLFPRARDGKVLIAVTVGGSTKFEKVMEFTASEGLVWEIGPVELRKPDGRPEKAHLYQGSRKLAKRMTAALDAVPAEQVALRAAAESCRALLADMDTYMDLMRPMKSGQRGQAGSVEFKKALLRANEKGASSKAKIVVVSYQDLKELEP